MWSILLITSESKWCIQISKSLFSYWLRTLRSCFLSSLVEFRLTVSQKKSKMSQTISSQSGHVVFPIDPKNTGLVEDFEILLPVKFNS